MKTRILACLLLVSLAIAEEPAVRVWKSKAGTELEATLARPGLTEALLRKADGQTLAIPLDALSEADREHVWNEWEKEDDFFRQRRAFLRARKDAEEPVVPVFREGPWAGCAVVVRERNYTFLLTGNLKAGLILNHLSPEAPRQTLTALSPSFLRMNPQATGKERFWKDLAITKLKTTPTFPLILDASPRGSELRMEIEFENGRNGTLHYVFEPNEVRADVVLRDFRHPSDVSSVSLGASFPATHVFGDEVDMAAIKKRLEPWRLEMDPVEKGGKELIPWWQSAQEGLYSGVKVVGPWEPWRFVFKGVKGEKGREIQFVVYQGFAPYRNGFRLSRAPMEVEGDLVLEWAMELVR